MAGRTTSAGYRFPLASHPRSECSPTEERKRAPVTAAAPKKTYNDADYKECDAVKLDEIWKQSVGKEKNGTLQWETNWGFLTEFDPKGRPKTPKELPDKLNMYSDDVPNTNAGNFGSRLNTDLGAAMQKMEFQFNSHNRKKKLGNDMICY